MTQKMMITVPMAGFGSRMRPHTWSKAKPLIALAGKTVLDHCLAQFDSLPASFEREYVFIVSPNQLDQVQAYTQAAYPHLTVHYVVQTEMRGQADALYLARGLLQGPMLMSFSDTLIATDLAFLENEPVDALTWVKPVEDPRRFGVAQVDADGWVTHLVEKPQDLANNRVLVGFYYFRSGAALMRAIAEQMQRGLSLKGEYFLADAVNVMLEHGVRMRTHTTEVWLDAGSPSAVLETNRYLLEHGSANDAQIEPRAGVAVIPPVYIHPSAQIHAAVVGPHVSIGAGCHLQNVVIRNSILDENTRIQDMLVADSLLGQRVNLAGRAQSLNLGDDAWLKTP